MIKRFWKQFKWYIARDVIAERHKVFDDILNVQLSDGNWDYNEYMLGLANGMLMGKAVFGNTEYNPLKRPKKFIVDQT